MINIINEMNSLKPTGQMLLDSYREKDIRKASLIRKMSNEGW